MPPRRVIPLIVDETELQLRLPVRKADVGVIPRAGAGGLLPPLRVQ